MINNIIIDLLKSIFKDVRPTNSDGSQCKVNCPRCAKQYNNYEPDNKYNLEITLKKKKYHCWKCEAKGPLKNIFKFYGNSKIYGIYRDNFEFNLNDEDDNFSFDEDDDIFEITLPKEFISFKDYNDYDEKFVEPYNYLTQTRKIKLNIMQKYNIGFCPKGLYKNRIIVPSYNNYDKLNYFISRTYRNETPTYRNPPYTKEIIINEKYIDWNCSIYIVEGFFDFLSVPLNTLILNGKGLSYTVLSKIKQYNPPITLLIDGDALKTCMNIINTLEHNDISNINFVYLDENFDIDEIRRKFGIKYLSNYILENRKILTDVDKLWLKNYKL